MKLTCYIWLILTMASLVAIPASDAQIRRPVDYDGQTEDGDLKETINWMENQVNKALDSGCDSQIDNVIIYIQTIWGPYIQSMTSKVTPFEKYYIIKEYNRLLYMLGLRNCESPDQTWYRGQCHPIGISRSPICPKNQQLYDGPDNIGYCYCQKNVGNSNSLIDMDGQCYLLNQQGPCGHGQWLVVKDQIPMCERVPRGCPADGQHVYWSCNDGQTMCPYGRIHSHNNRKKCSRIGSAQPSCGAGAKLFRNGMTTYCGSPNMVNHIDKIPSVSIAVSPVSETCPNDPFFDSDPPPQCPEGADCYISPSRIRDCPRGFSRDPLGRCRRRFQQSVRSETDQRID